MYYIDAHCHLNDDQLFPRYLEHAEDFLQIGGRQLVIVGCDVESSRRACEVTRAILLEWRSQFAVGRRHPICTVAATIGIHPSEACFGAITADNLDATMQEIRSVFDVEHEVIVAIGECGIDMHYEGSAGAIDVQKALFARQCAWAQEIGLPLVVHSRDGFAETYEVMRQYPDVVYYVHCFGYGPEEVQKFLEGFPRIYFGFDGNISYPKAQLLREACIAVPADRLVLETDSPYLAPQGLRGTMNVPANVVKVYEYVSGLREMDVEALCDQVAKNVAEMYRR